MLPLATPRRTVFLVTFVAATVLATGGVDASSVPTGPLAAEPTVPRPGTEPCVLKLFDDKLMTVLGDFEYAPPECPPPWAKVVLEIDLATPAPRNATMANLQVSLLHLASFPTDSETWVLFMGAPQEHNGVASWRVERDLTDYSYILTEPRPLIGFIEFSWDNGTIGIDPPAIRGSARMLFYPPGRDAAPPRVPDRIYTTARAVLPRNIVRAYVDVIAQGLDGDLNSDRFWYSCLPWSAIAAYPALTSPFALGDVYGGFLSSTPLGCGGGSYREVEVLIDGTVVGIAPVFPWLPSNLHRRWEDTVDLPLPSAHALNFVPYRVDITPFAAELNDGVAHKLSLRPAGDTNRGLFALDAKLLVYLDPATKVVTGAITRSTLGRRSRARVTDTLAAASDVLRGTVTTTLRRTDHAEGYLDTSSGRIYSAVRNTIDFRNVQDLVADGLTYPDYRGYRQRVTLDSRMNHVSRRTRGGVTVSATAVSTYYPLRLGYAMTGVLLDNGEGGHYAEYHRAAASVLQLREQTMEQQLGTFYYRSDMYDLFQGRQSRDFIADTRTGWRGQRNYIFRDTLGDCYTAARTAVDGGLATTTTGIGCPGDSNSMEWYVHPDGSPDDLGWAE